MSSGCELQESLVSQVLQLLTNLVRNMIVVGMFHLKFVHKRIYFICGEIFVGYSLHAFQYIHQPTTTVNLCLLKRQSSLVKVYHLRLIFLLTILDDENLSTLRNIANLDVTPSPSSSPSRISQRLSFFNNIRHEEVVGYQQQIVHLPIRVRHHKQMRVAQRGDAFNHRRVCTIRNLVSNSSRLTLLALQLEIRLAVITEEICYRLVRFLMSQNRSTTNGAEHVSCHPVLSHNAGNLRTAMIAYSQ